MAMGMSHPIDACNGVRLSAPVAVPFLSPGEADDLARYWEWPVDWWWERICPDYSDVQADEDWQ